MQTLKTLGLGLWFQGCEVDHSRGVGLWTSRPVPGTNRPCPSLALPNPLIVCGFQWWLVSLLQMTAFVGQPL